MIPLNIATDGHIDCGDCFTLSVATVGHLTCIEEDDNFIPTNPGGGSSTTKSKRIISNNEFYNPILERQQLNNQIIAEDNEILTIIKIFLECQ